MEYIYKKGDIVCVWKASDKINDFNFSKSIKNLEAIGNHY